MHNGVFKFYFLKNKRNVLSGITLLICRIRELKTITMPETRSYISLRFRDTQFCCHSQHLSIHLYEKTQGLTKVRGVIE